MHRRAIPADDYPLSYMSSPFFDTLHDIYLCRRTQISVGRLAAEACPALYVGVLSLEPIRAAGPLTRPSAARLFICTLF
jgi:hypothetical protein